MLLPLIIGLDPRDLLGQFFFILCEPFFLEQVGSKVGTADQLYILSKSEVNDNFLYCGFQPPSL